MQQLPCRAKNFCCRHHFNKPLVMCGPARQIKRPSVPVRRRRRICARPHAQNPLSSFYSGGISSLSRAVCFEWLPAMDKCLLHEGHKRIRDFFTFNHENVLALCENKIKGNTACARRGQRERRINLMPSHATRRRCFFQLFSLA
jgi:hypothetical protein